MVNEGKTTTIAAVTGVVLEPLASVPNAAVTMGSPTVLGGTISRLAGQGPTNTTVPDTSADTVVAAIGRKGEKDWCNRTTLTISAEEVQGGMSQ